MKKLLYILMAAMLAFAFPADAKKKAPGGDPKPDFAELVHDFGVVSEKGGPVSHDFNFVNKGDGNFIIIDATAECGCTRPDYPKEPIAPGKKNKVKVTYNPLGRPGPFEKVVTLKTNAHPRKIRLKIKGNVK